LPAISVGVTLLFIAGFGSFSTAKGMTPFHEWMLSLLLTFFVTKLFFIIMYFRWATWGGFYTVLLIDNIDK
jgi:hypothetical protein